MSSAIDNRQSTIGVKGGSLPLGPFAFSLFSTSAATSNLPRAGTPVGTFLFSSLLGSYNLVSLQPPLLHVTPRFVIGTTLLSFSPPFSSAPSASMMCSKIAITAA